MIMISVLPPFQDLSLMPPPPRAAASAPRLHHKSVNYHICFGLSNLHLSYRDLSYETLGIVSLGEAEQRSCT